MCHVEPSWLSHIAHMVASCRTHESITSHIWLIHATQMT